MDTDWGSNLLNPRLINQVLILGKINLIVIKLTRLWGVPQGSILGPDRLL